MQKGFGLLGIIITVAIIALAGWGGFGLYSSYFKQEKDVLQNDLGAIKKAEDARNLLNQNNQQINKEL